MRLSLNPLVCDIHLHFLLPAGHPLLGKGKGCWSDTDLTQWVENVAFNDVFGFHCSGGVVGVEEKKKNLSPLKC